MQSGAHLVHATAVAVAIDPDGPPAGALLLGSSGSGKSAAALALVESCPFRRSCLVSDDATLLYANANREGGVMARAPKPSAPLLEVRGFGPAAVRSLGEAPILAGFDFSQPARRLPDPETRAFGDFSLPVWGMAKTADAALRIRVILRAILGRQAP